MPPRLRGSCCPPQQLLNSSPSTSSSLLPCATTLAAPAHRPHLATATHAPSPSCGPSSSNRSFSTTPAAQMTVMRRRFWDWIKKNEDRLRQPEEKGPHYLGSLKNEALKGLPFPNNPHFKSQPVLSDMARENIWREVMVRGMPLKAVSATFNVDMRRVAAVVRMKEIEKRWEREGKPLALPYARAMEKLLPTSYLRDSDPPFEPINDIHVHSHTMQQLFIPTSESREFTRADAARAFGERILPPDAKMRIPELVDMERRVARGEVEPEQARAEFVSAAAESEKQLAERQRGREERAEERRVRVETGRFEFRFEKINAEDVGPTGRKRKAVGWRYGVPFMDRRRGEVKIPTEVV